MCLQFFRCQFLHEKRGPNFLDFSWFIINFQKIQKNILWVFTLFLGDLTTQATFKSPALIGLNSVRKIIVLCGINLVNFETMNKWATNLLLLSWFYVFCKLLSMMTVRVDRHNHAPDPPHIKILLIRFSTWKWTLS